MFQYQIQIINCNNGWLVIIPMQQQPDIVPGIGMSLEDYGKAVSQVVSRMQKDPLLEKLQAATDEEKPAEKIPDPLPKTPTHFIFKTFPEVLDFLKNLISFNH